MNQLHRHYVKNDETVDYRGFSVFKLKGHTAKAVKKRPLARSVNVARQGKAGIVRSDRKVVSN